MMMMMVKVKFWTVVRIRGKITELFCAVLCTVVVHNDMHTHVNRSYR